MYSSYLPSPGRTAGKILTTCQEVVEKMVSRTRVNRPKCSRHMSIILPLAVTFVILTSLPRCLSSHSTSHAHPKTLLTLKPPRVTRGNWLRQPLQSPTDILPEFVGTLKFDTKLEWAAPCFQNSVAYLNRTEPKEGGDEQDLGGMVLNLDVSLSTIILTPACSYLCL